MADPERPRRGSHRRDEGPGLTNVFRFARLLLIVGPIILAVVLLIVTLDLSRAHAETATTRRQRGYAPTVKSAFVRPRLRPTTANLIAPTPPARAPSAS